MATKKKVTLPTKSYPLSRNEQKSKSADYVHVEHIADSHTNLRSLEKMLNPSVFFQGVRESRKGKSGSPLSSPRMNCIINLQQAARDGQVEIVRQHLSVIGKEKKKLNRKDQDQTTALHYAVRYGHYLIVKLLVEAGAGVNVQGEYGATPLHYAARYVVKTAKTPAATPFHTPHSSPPSKPKIPKGLRQLITQKRFALKKDIPQTKRKISTGKTLKHKFLKSSNKTSNSTSKLAEEVPLQNIRRNTIHSSLEDIPLLLQNDSKETSRSITPVKQNLKEMMREESFEYGYAQNNDLVEKPIVIIGELTHADSAEMKTIDALIIPQVRNICSPDMEDLQLSPPLKQAVLWPHFEDMEGENDSSNEEFDQNLYSPPISLSAIKAIPKMTKLLDIPGGNAPEEYILTYLLEHKANVNAKDYYGSTPLHYAAMRGNVIAVRQLLMQKTINIEATDRTQMTALHAAASTGSYNVCKLLLGYGSNLRCFDEEEMTPLHFAAMEGHYAIVELLFNHGEEQGGYIVIAKMIMDQDRDDQTALHLAVENGHIEIVKLCIEKGANVNFVKTNLITPLHLACTSGQLDIVSILVESEADIEAKNALQETPLHRAALFNRVNIVEYLLERDAEINCRDKDKETPLMMSARKNNVETVRLLLKQNADIFVKDSSDKTCLYVAAEDDCVDVFMVLREHKKVKILLEEFDKNENTPLHIAAMKGNLKIVEMLLEMGACIDSKNDQNLTPLHLAAKHGRSTIVKMLLLKDISIVNDEDDASNTPLHLAALEGHVKVVEILLECGAAVDARNATLWTPLDCTASRGWTWCAECLLGADSLIDPTDKAKTTPLHLASKEGHVEMIRLLLSRKADIARKDNLGRNCLDWAIENNQRGAAMAILSDDSWKLALRNCTIEGNKVTTPMRKLIKKLPDVAEKVFDQCIKGSTLSKEHPLYEISCTYEFLEDTFTDWGPGLYESMELPTSQMNMNVNLITNLSKTNKSKSSRLAERLRLPGYARKHSEMKENHPLKNMVQNERTKLLSHPLVTYLLRHKWRSCGRYVYYSKLLLYIIYLIFLTGYALTVIADEFHISCITASNQTTNCNCVPVVKMEYADPPSIQARRFFVDFGKYALIVLAFISVLIELMKLGIELHNYFRIHSAMEFLSYTLAILYALESFSWPDGGRIEMVHHSRCTSWFRSLGAFTVWLSWISLVLFLRKFPKLGIYVVMFTDILKTFAQFFTVFALFVTAFGLGFHLLLYQQRPLSFATPARSILKTTMGMLGEFEYDTVFNDAYNPFPMAWFIYVAYLVINCIILMNLLVGLAVDDIKGVQEQAALKRLAMQVDLTLDVEKALPISFQRKLIKIEESILPNAEKAWSVWSFWSLKTPSSMNPKNTVVEQVRIQQNEIKDTVRTLRNKVKVLESQNNRMENMLEALLKHHNITVQTDEV